MAQAAVKDESAVDAQERGRHQTALHLLVGVGVALAHVAMWPYGFLEEWGLARAWQVSGPQAVVDGLGTTAGRPLHLLPAYLGLAASDGRLLGMYAVTGLLTGGTYLAARWAFTPLRPRPLLLTATALGLALHPFWAAGWLLRFQPAQLSVLALVLWVGWSVRYLHGARALDLILAVSAILVGLLCYQAVALVPVLVTAALWLHAAAAGTGRWLPRRRHCLHAAATAGGIVAVGVHSTLVAPRLVSSSYEAGLQGGALDLRTSVSLIFDTVLAAPGGRAAVLFAMAAVLVAAARGLRAPRSSTAPVLVLTGLAVLLVLLAPLTALTYASTTLHLRDPQRVLMPLTTALLVLGILAGQRADVGRRLGGHGQWLAVLLVVPALVSLADWRGEGSRNYALLERVVSSSHQAGPGSTLVVVDRSGKYGDVYGWLPPTLETATSVVLGAPSQVTLCTPADTERDHPVAQRYPISSTPDCEGLLVGRGVLRSDIVELDGRVVEVLVVAPAVGETPGINGREPARPSATGTTR